LPDRSTALRQSVTRVDERRHAGDADAVRAIAARRGIAEPLVDAGDRSARSATARTPCMARACTRA
jgi:hypothetical protein